MPRRSWTDEQLATAVAQSTTLSQVMRALGLRPGKYDTVRGHIERLGLDATHIRSVSGSGTRRPRDWSDDDLRRTVAASTSYTATMKALGYRPSGGIHRWLSAHIRDLDIDTSHFTGQGWAAGRRVRSVARPLEQILVAGSTYSSSTLRKRLISAGLKSSRCEHCGLAEWQGQVLPLVLDHVNGDHTDNRLENLRVLCPNCHSQTPTWCNRKRDAG